MELIGSGFRLCTRSIQFLHDHVLAINPAKKHLKSMTLTLVQTLYWHMVDG
jgi:hypothetical protein